MNWNIDDVNEEIRINSYILKIKIKPFRSYVCLVVFHNRFPYITPRPRELLVRKPIRRGQNFPRDHIHWTTFYVIQPRFNGATVANRESRTDVCTNQTVTSTIRTLLATMCVGWYTINKSNNTHGCQFQTSIPVCNAIFYYFTVFTLEHLERWSGWRTGGFISPLIHTPYHHPHTPGEVPKPPPNRIIAASTPALAEAVWQGKIVFSAVRLNDFERETQNRSTGSLRFLSNYTSTIHLCLPLFSGFAEFINYLSLSRALLNFLNRYSACTRHIPGGKTCGNKIFQQIAYGRHKSVLASSLAIADGSVIRPRSGKMEGKRGVPKGWSKTFAIVSKTKRPVSVYIKQRASRFTLKSVRIRTNIPAHPSTCPAPAWLLQRLAARCVFLIS